MPWSSDRLLALVGGVFIVYAFGVLVDADSLARQAGIAAAVALVIYTAGIATTTLPPVRWPLLLGTAALALAVYADLPVPSGGSQFLSPADVDQLNQLWQRSMAHTRWIALGLLLAVAGGLVAVRALPHRRRPWALLVAGVPAVLAVGSTVLSISTSAHRADDRTAELIGAVWLPVLAGLLAFALAILSTQRGTRGWAAVLGGTALGVVALWLAVDTATAMPSARHNDGFLITGALVYTGSRLAVEEAMRALAMLAGPLLIVVAFRNLGVGAAARRPPNGTP